MARVQLDGNSNDHEIPVVLSIAGSDSSGGAGIQADMKAFWRQGVYGITAVTAVIAEVPGHVASIETVEPQRLADQIRLLFRHFPVGAVKVGVLRNEAQIELVTAILREEKQKRDALPLVIDPVLISTAGMRLSEVDVGSPVCDAWWSLADVLTPNVEEAERLLGCSLTRDNFSAIRQAARALADRYGGAVLVKGGHIDGGTSADVLVDGDSVAVFEAERLIKPSIHGTGCVLSAGIAACLAKGMALPDAVAVSKQMVTDGIRGAYRWSTGMEALALE